MSIESFGQLRPNMNTEKNKLELLKENLKEIFDLSKYSTFGHGTDRARAENILRTGLEASTNALDSTAIVLDDTEETYNRILHWKHHDSKSIVIIAVPNQPAGEMGGYWYFDNIFEELPEDRKSDPRAGSEFRKEYYIPSQFIKGYIDVDSLSFIKNDLYDSEAKIKIKELPDNGPSHKSPEREPMLLPEKEFSSSVHGDDDWE